MSLPELLQNVNGFDLGDGQSGDINDDEKLPKCVPAIVNDVFVATIILTISGHRVDDSMQGEIVGALQHPGAPPERQRLQLRDLVDDVKVPTCILSLRV